ncbi:hypothetical protein DNTS_016025 [Danionella cerebrum]|nr:hypothetical protein DNTS_016025 [Danionella translucida]
MPLLGKIVVIKRNGTDGTEFPLTASCLFGRKLDCDIRIQLPQVSKEHCKIELNENKELILTNLSSVNPTRINGQVLNQSERLKHEDVITIIDRSFRFEYPPPKTPKKRLSTAGKDKTVQALQDQQDQNTPVPLEKKKSEQPFDTCLKDGSNWAPIVEHAVEEQAEDGKLKKESMSPFSELYQMVKQDLVAKSPWKSEVQKTPIARPFTTPSSTKKRRSSKHSFENINESNTSSLVNTNLEDVLTADVEGTPKPVTTSSSTKKLRSSEYCFEKTNTPATPSLVDADIEEVAIDVEGTPKLFTTPSSTKKRRSSKHNFENTNAPGSTSSVNADIEDVLPADEESSPKQGGTPFAKKRRVSMAKSSEISTTLQSSGDTHVDSLPSVGSNTPKVEKHATPGSQKKSPQKFSADEVVQVLLETPKSLKRRSGRALAQSLTLPMPTDQVRTPGKSVTEISPRTSPRSNAGKRFQVQNVLDEMKESPLKDANTSVNKQDGGTASHTKASVTRPVRKRVSFGGQLSPELFDKRLPPNSPLRRGATPRRSLGPFQKPQSLLRRASTIGLLALRLGENSSKKASPKHLEPTVKTPSPGKRSPAAKAKTPSPKCQKSPSAASKVSTPLSIPSSLKTPVSVTETSVDTSSTESPRVQGRFSVSRISTPSPVQEQVEKAEVRSTIVEDVPEKCITPKMPIKRKSMKCSARKTPKSSIRSALEVMRSRRSGASRANLRVLSSWADIVKFGQMKPQTEVVPKKKPSKSNVVKRAVPPKPKTPVRRLKEHISTGHAASPVTIVVGKAHMRPNHSVGAAPKVVPNLAVSKKDLKMDEDFTGVADIFKTPANTKSKNAVNEFPLDESSMIKTPEESGEMMVSPLSVVSNAPCGKYNNEAVKRLLLDNQSGSVLEDDGLATNEDNAASDHESTQEPPLEKTVPAAVETPNQKPTPYSCLTGVKRLMKTPKQKNEPLEDLRGKLLKTPKQRKPPQEESLEGVKELLKTPKFRGVPVEDLVGVKRLMQTPKQKNSPVLCAAGLKMLMQTPKERMEQSEDFTGVEDLMKTPKVKEDAVENKVGLKRTSKRKRSEVEEDLTGVQQLMKTPRHRGEPVEEQLGIKRLMQTPKEKVEQVEDLTGVKELMKTPKHRGEAVGSHFGISKLMKTPRVKGVTAEEDFTGLKELVEEPENHCNLMIENTESNEMHKPVFALDEGSAFSPAQDIDEKENASPVKPTEIDVSKSGDDQNITEVVVSSQSEPEIKVVDPIGETDGNSVSVEAVNDISGKDVEPEEQPISSDCSSTAVDANLVFATSEQEGEPVISLPAKNVQRSSHRRVAQTGKNETTKAPVVLSLIEEERANDQLPSSPVRGRRGRKAVDIPEVTASPVVKSSRGRFIKQSNVKEEFMFAEASTADIPDSLPEPTKPRRGGRAKQSSIAEVEPVPEDSQSANIASAEEQIKSPLVKPGMRKKINKPASKANNSASEAIPNASAVVPDAPTTEELVQAPVVKSGRRKKVDKAEKQPSEDAEPVHDAIAIVPYVPVTEELVQAPVVKSGRRKKVDKAEKQPSEDAEPVLDASDVPATEELVQAPVVKLGRRKKVDKAEKQPSEDAEPVLDASDVPATEELVQAPVVKSGRRKKVDKAEKQPSEDEEPVLDATEELVQAPVVKSGRRKKVDKAEKQPSEDADPVLDGSDVPATEELVQAPVVKSGRRKKVDKAEKQPSEDAEPVLDASDVPATEELVQAPVVKLGRRKKVDKAEKQPSEDAEPVLDASDVPATEELVQAPVVKSGRRRKVDKAEKQPSEDAEPVLDASAVVPDVPATEELVQAPVVKSGRRKKVDKTEKQPSKDSEPVLDAAAVVPDAPATEELVQAPVVKTVRRKKVESSSEQSSETVCDEIVVVPEASASATRPRRGKTTKKEPIKPEPNLVLESEGTTSAPAVAEKPVVREVKSVRGRKGEPESAMGQLLDDQVMLVNQNVAEENARPVKRGRRVVSESLPIVSSRARKLVVKAQSDVDEQIKSPVVKSGSRKKINKVEHTPEELQEESSERACDEIVVAPEASISATRSRRGRTTKKEAIKPEPSLVLENEVTRAVVEPETDEDAEVIRKGTRKAKVTFADPVEQDETAGLESVPEISESSVKRGRRGVAKPASSRGLKSAIQVQEQPLSEDQIKIAVVKPGRGKKTDKPEQPSEDVDANAAVLQVPDAAEEQIQAPVVKSGRRKKIEKAEHPLEEHTASSESVCEENVELEATFSAARPRRGNKPLASGCKAAVKAPPKDVDSSETQVEPVKHSKRTAKEPVLEKEEKLVTKTNEPASGKTARRGRSVKAEEAVEAPPVRRTRRK